MKYVNSCTAVEVYSGASPLWVGLKKTCRSMPASSLLYSSKLPAMMVPGRLGLVSTNVNVFVGRPLVLGFLEGGLSVTVVFPLPITRMWAGTVMLMVEVKRFRP